MCKKAFVSSIIGYLIPLVRLFSDAEPESNSARNFSMTNSYIRNSKMFFGLCGERVYISVNEENYTVACPPYYKAGIVGIVTYHLYAWKWIYA